MVTYIALNSSVRGESDSCHRSVQYCSNEGPSSLFFLPFLPFPPFSFFLLLKFIRLLTEQLAFSTFGILLALQAASILDLQI